MQNNDTPKLRSRQEKGKVTLYFDIEIDELYRIGKENGWNTPEIVRRAATEALTTRASKLRRKATSKEESA